MKINRIVFPILLLVILLPFLFTNACKHDPVGIDQLDTVCFESNVKPIIQTSCGIAHCHGSGSAAAGFSATDYSSIMKIVSPGNAAGSKLYKVITEVNGENMMPPSRPLSKEQRTLIMVWIEQGAKETKCPTIKK